MSIASTDQPGQAVEKVFQSLKAERATYIAQLTALLERAGGGKDVEGYLKRIENINTIMMRLASVSMKH